jgi:hypothetical protein
MRQADFERMIRRFADEIPPHFYDGIVEVTVSPRAVPHPERADVYTLGECIPLEAGGEGEGLQSRIVLYWGSFRALAALDDGFDWREEAWETLTHELRHHLEWRARAPNLERLDDAAEANFARRDGDPFPADYHRDGERVVEGVWRIEDDFFVERTVDALPATVELSWHGRRHRVDVPAGAHLPAYVALDGVAEPPPGELVLVLRRRPRLRDLFRGAAPPWSGGARATPLDAARR